MLDATGAGPASLDVLRRPARETFGDEQIVFLQHHHVAVAVDALLFKAPVGGGPPAWRRKAAVSGRRARGTTLRR